MAMILFSSILVLVLIILMFSLVLFYKDKNYTPPVVVELKEPAYRTLEECSIEELANRIASEELTDKELLRVVSMVAKEHKFPGKSSGNDSQHHLKFVQQFCLNDSANGSTIVKMSNTLKAVNLDYKREIEREERLAVKRRDEAAIAENLYSRLK